MKKITNKMLAASFGKSEQNFKQIDKDFRAIYVEAYKYRELMKLAGNIDSDQIDNLHTLISIIQSGDQ